MGWLCRGGRRSGPPRPSGTPPFPRQNARNLTAEVTNFINRTDSNDDTSVRVEYRVRNTGSGTVPEYEVTFRIEASEGGDRLHQIQGELLREEQSDVGDFVVELDGADAVDVQVDELWFEE